MRVRHAVVCLAIALISAPVVSDELLVALAIEPETAPLEVTLESAARANDFPTFDALYRASPDPAFRALHELWTYSMTDRVGAFYGAETYEKLKREHPRYAEFIAPHKIVDGNGEVFYPSSETRAFLLEQLAAAPRGAELRIAEVRNAAPRIAERRLPAGRYAGILPAGSREEPGPAGSRRSGRQDGGAPLQVRLEAGAPLQVRQDSGVPLKAAAPAPAPPLTPAEDLALLETAIASAPAAASAPAPARIVETTTTMPAPPKATNRGILLVIIGLVGIGLLALIVRAPREVIP